MTTHLVVDARIVRRVIRHQRGLSGLNLQVPHAHCCVVDRAPLLTVVTERELGKKGASLPGTVVLVARPEREDPHDLWRRAFHGFVHQQLDERVRSGSLTPALIRQRINRIGQTEFDEVRAVLEGEELLFAAKDDREAYIEFAAFYLELLHFEPDALDKFFPNLRDHAAVEEALTRDVDVSLLLDPCRPPGAPDLDPGRKVAAVPSLPEERITRSPRVSRASTSDPRDRRRRNVVRALLDNLLEKRDAQPDIDELADRLATALSRPERVPELAPDGAAWADVITALADAAVRSGSPHGVEARVLHDLQKACVDAERQRSAVDAITWVTSLFRRPLVRPLPTVSVVRVARHVQHAFEASHASTLLAKQERRHLEQTFHAAIRAGRANVRAVIRPALYESLAEVGLAPGSVPERVAREKLAEELLDLLLERGSLGLSQLRDALSRSNLKLPNLNASALVRGDALLRVDTRLATRLDGIYRGGEVYLRFLQKLSSIAFGTPLGRLVTLHVLLPLLLSFVVLEGLQHLVHAIAGLFGHHHHIVMFTPPSFLTLALVFYANLHSPAIRNATRALLRFVVGALHAVFIGLPRLVFRSAPVRALLRGRTTSLVAKPVAIGALLYLIATQLGLDRSTALIGTSAVVLLTAVFLGTATGERVDEAVTELLLGRVRDLSRHVLPGLFALVLDVFRIFVERVERGIYTVDEWLTFKDGQSTASQVGKGVLFAVWFFVTYLLRIYVNVLIEPQVNPIKHFPVVTVSHKIILPLSPTILAAVQKALAPLGMVISSFVAGSTVLLLPGAFGFLTWELKENWKLYEQNRPRTIEPVRIGHHGETMNALLVRGFHSGTIPKVYARLRRSVSRGESKVNAYRAKLHEVEHALETFVERELVGLLRESPRWGAGELSVHTIDVSSNRIRIGIACPEVGAEIAYLHFEEQSGLLVAAVATRGFVSLLEEGPRATFETAVAGLYKLAGVDLVREQIEALIGPGTPYDIADEGLVVWPGEAYETEVIYDLAATGTLVPVIRGAPPSTSPPALDATPLIFKRQAIAWSSWVDAFREDAVAMPRARIIAGPSLLSAR